MTNLHLPGADFGNADLRSASLFGTTLTGASMVGVSLQHAALHHAQLQGAVLMGAQLEYSILMGANLQDANLDLAQLNRARLGVVPMSVVGRNPPRNRTVPSCTANPSRLWSPPPAHQLRVHPVEDEEPLQLRPGRLPDVPAERRSLLVTEKLHRHSRPTYGPAPPQLPPPLAPDPVPILLNPDLLRAALPTVLARRAGAMHDLLRHAHGSGWEPWASMYVEGHGEHWSSAAAFIAQHEELWRRALS